MAEASVDEVCATRDALVDYVERSQGVEEAPHSSGELYAALQSAQSTNTQLAEMVHTLKELLIESHATNAVLHETLEDADEEVRSALRPRAHPTAAHRVLRIPHRQLAVGARLRDDTTRRLRRAEAELGRARGEADAIRGLEPDELERLEAAALRSSAAIHTLLTERRADERLCSCCYSRPRDTAFVPCGKPTTNAQRSPSPSRRLPPVSLPLRRPRSLCAVRPAAFRGRGLPLVPPARPATAASVCELK